MEASSNFILNRNLGCFGVGIYMVKLCIEKMLILRCILPQKIEPLLEKNNPSPPEKTRTP